MSMTLAQIYALNPALTILDTDLFYLVQSPYAPGNDAGISGLTLKSLFGGTGTITSISAGTGITLTPNPITTTGTISLTTPVSLTNGGTNASLVASNGGIFYSTATAAAILAGTATAGQIIRSGASTAPTWSTATYPATAGAIGNVLTSDGTNWISSAATGGNPLTTKGDLFTFTTVDARLPVGTIDGQFLQVNSGAATGLAWSTATIPSTANNVARILRSDGTNWVQTTATFADSYGASEFLYSNGANNVAGLATAINGLPVTGNTGIPVMLAGPAATGRLLTSNAAAAPAWSTATFPSTGGAAGNILISDGTNYISSTSLWPNTVGTSGKVVISNGTSNVYSTPTFPNASATALKIIRSDGTNWIASTVLYPDASVTSGKFIISDGTNYIASTSIMPNTVGAVGKIIRSDGTVNAYTTATFPDTAGAAANVLTSDGTNWSSAAPAAAATSVIVDDTTTNATMYPTWVTANTGSLPLKVTSTKLSFNPSSGVMTLTGKLSAITDITSSSGLTLLKTNYTASAVNYVGLQNNTTGNRPVISGAGTDTNVTLSILGQGTGGVDILGVSTNSNAPAGYVGELISSLITSASAVSLTTGTPKNITSISLTAGDWDVWGNITYIPAATTSISILISSISSTTGAHPDSSLYFLTYYGTAIVTSGLGVGGIAPSQRITLSATTTYYLVGQANFSVSTLTACGNIFARRRR